MNGKLSKTIVLFVFEYAKIHIAYFISYVFGQSIFHVSVFPCQLSLYCIRPYTKKALFVYERPESCRSYTKRAVFVYGIACRALLRIPRPSNKAKTLDSLKSFS